MKIHALFLAMLLVLSSFLFTGEVEALESNKPVAAKLNKPPEIKRHKADLKSQKALVKNRAMQVKPERMKVTQEAVVVTAEPKVLDLSAPYRDYDLADRATELHADSYFQKTNIFSNTARKRTLPVQFDGRLLMSPEPEVEKRKSADGAGIVINLQP
jgi:hypothetical protein